MPDFNPRPEVRPEAFEFAGAPNGGSFVRSGPQRSFSSAEELELALELLQVTSAAEFERFLSDLFKRAWRGVEPVGSEVIGPLQTLFKTIAKKALPSLTTATGGSFVGPEVDATTGKLGSLVGRALEAEVAGMAAADGDLEKCRQLFERYRQFVQLSGKAATAAASAPAGVNPIMAAQRSLVHSANERLTQKAASPRLAAIFAAGAPAHTASKTAAASTAATFARAAGQQSRIRTKVPGECTCSICELPPGSCQCSKIGRSGRWFRNGSRIIVNC